MKFNYARDGGDPAADNPVQGTVGADGRWDPGATSEAGAGNERPA